MRLIPVRLWLLILLSATLQIASFPIAGPLPYWRSSLAWISIVPFLLALLSKDRNGHQLTIKNSALLGYLCGICWYLGNCYWIYQTMYLYGGLPKPVAAGILLLFALYLGLYHALFAICIAISHRRVSNPAVTLFFAPFAWVTIELARARITGFPWDLLGNSQIDNLLMTRLAPIAGVMGLSFVLAAASAAITIAFLYKTQRKFIFSLAIVVLLAVMLLGDSGHGIDQDQVSLTQSSPQAVMMQENLSVGAEGREVAPLSTGDELIAFSNASLHPRTIDGFSGSGPFWTDMSSTQPTLILWPEAPSHLQSNDLTFRAAMSQLATTAKAPLIIGSLGVDFDNSAPRGYYLYDSASLFSSDGAYQGRYDKIHLVPWGEYVPFKQFFAFAQKLTEGVGDMDRGHARTVFTTGGHTYGVAICYESIFGDEIRQFVLNGAQVLVNISDDGWYGDTGAPWQHLDMTRMRAIENHRWLLLDTNTGITTAIDPHGRTTLQAPRHVRGAFAFPFAFEQGTTFYTRHGDWFAWLCVIVTAAALAFTANKNATRITA